MNELLLHTSVRLEHFEEDNTTTTTNKQKRENKNEHECSSTNVHISWQLQGHYNVYRAFIRLRIQCENIFASFGFLFFFFFFFLFFYFVFLGNWSERSIWTDIQSVNYVQWSACRIRLAVTAKFSCFCSLFSLIISSLDSQIDRQQVQKSEIYAWTNCIILWWFSFTRAGPKKKGIKHRQYNSDLFASIHISISIYSHVLHIVFLLLLGIACNFLEISLPSCVCVCMRMMPCDDTQAITNGIVSSIEYHQ